jgi:cytochrome subunit of sulfide dehydrogenase
MRTGTYRRLAGLAALLLSMPAPGAEPFLDTCFDCHGADGMGKADPMYPVIAGIPAAHIEEAIYAYIDGARQCIREPRMCETAAALTESEVSAAAEYFSGLVRDYNLEDFDAELAEKGAILHERHCGACHVPPHDEDVAYAIGIPLHGQRPDYIRYAIGAYFGGRREPLLDTMAHEIQQLDGDDFDALVNYYSSYRFAD